jgi:hypothetical protein
MEFSMKQLSFEELHKQYGTVLPSFGEPAAPTTIPTTVARFGAASSIAAPLFLIAALLALVL